MGTYSAQLAGILRLTQHLILLLIQQHKQPKLKNPGVPKGIRTPVLTVKG